MKSRIKIDFADPSGKGIEPVIRVDINDSDDPRDGLLRTLFQSVSNGDKLQFRYSGDSKDTEGRHSTIFIHAPKNNKTQRCEPSDDLINSLLSTLFKDSEVLVQGAFLQQRVTKKLQNDYKSIDFVIDGNVFRLI